MPKVILSVASNAQAAAHLQWAAERLASQFGTIHISRKLWTADVHGTGVYYLNQLAVTTTVLTAAALEQRLKDIEAETRRTKGNVTLDLDLLLYGTQRYHEADWSRTYIQQLITDIL